MAIQLPPPLGAPQAPGQSNILQQLMQLLGGGQSLPAQRGQQFAQNDSGIGANPVLQINPLATTPMMQRGGASQPKQMDPAISAARDHLENMVSEWAKGNMNAPQVQAEFKKLGWTTDLRRGGSDVEAFDPTGMAHYLTP